ncbi:MAG TPA: hypothetical protein VGP26_27185 [Actinophytocola sp.]|jgi:hypothetical protein|nr:hypothetical protein [Actinophytocola sp.]
MRTALAAAGAVLFGALLLGAPDAAAAPPPAHPTDVRAPITDPGPQLPTRRPRPEVATPVTDVAVADPCTEDCPPPDDPQEPSAQPEQPDTGQSDTGQSDTGQSDTGDTGNTGESQTGHSGNGPAVDEPAAPPSPSAKPVDQPRSVPAAIPTPSRIDTGEGPGDPANWWLVGGSALALLGLAAGGGYLWIRRGERSAR